MPGVAGRAPGMPNPGIGTPNGFHIFCMNSAMSLNDAPRLRLSCRPPCTHLLCASRPVGSSALPTGPPVPVLCVPRLPRPAWPRPARSASTRSATRDDTPVAALGPRLASGVVEIPERFGIGAISTAALGIFAAHPCPFIAGPTGFRSTISTIDRARAAGAAARTPNAGLDEAARVRARQRPAQADVHLGIDAARSNPAATP